MRRGKEGFILFPMSFRPKVNENLPMESKVSYFEAAVKYFNYYAKGEKGVDRNIY